MRKLRPKERWNILLTITKQGGWNFPLRKREAKRLNYFVKYPEFYMLPHKIKLILKFKDLVGRTRHEWVRSNLDTTSLQSLKQTNSEGSDLPSISQMWETKMRPSDFRFTSRKNLEPYPKYTVCHNKSQLKMSLTHIAVWFIALSLHILPILWWLTGFIPIFYSWGFGFREENGLDHAGTAVFKEKLCHGKDTAFGVRGWVWNLST